MQNDDRSVLTARLALLVAILAVSTSSIMIRFAQQEAPSLAIAAYRLCIAAIILIPAVWGKREELKRVKRTDWAWMGVSGVFLALHFASWITSLSFSTVASSVVFVSTTPLWVALITTLILKQPLKRELALGLGVALLGAGLIGGSDLLHFENGVLAPFDWETMLKANAIKGDALALCGAIMGAGYMVIGRQVRQGLSIISYTFIVYGVAALVLIGMAGFSGAVLTGYSQSFLFWVVLLAVVPQTAGHSVINWSLKYLSAAFVSVALLGEPIGSTVLAMFFFGEFPGLIKIAGAVLILAGIILSSRSEPRQ
ncbi:MAG TPA: DMT family transporter [Anaerolineaceae bacterium]|nr:DMT family transporter [Anaerolineaceae bacterium]HPN50865.1 DMT family transporter [Anaerolineaceae bacterium]